MDGASDYASAIRITPGYFRVFGATAQLGRLLTDEEEQLAAYCQIIAASPRHTVTIRTLDIGGDKPLPYLDLGEEVEELRHPRARHHSRQADGELRQ